MMRNTLKKIGIAFIAMVALSCCSCSEESLSSKAHKATARYSDNIQNKSGIVTEPAAATKQTTIETETTATETSYTERASEHELAVTQTTVKVEEPIEVTTVTTINESTEMWNQTETASTYSESYTKSDSSIVWKDGYQYYVVNPGDSWSAIAAYLDVDPVQLAAANGCSLNDIIWQDDYLFIPNEYVDYTQTNSNFMIRNGSYSVDNTSWQTGYDDQQYVNSYSNSGTWLSGCTLWSAPDSASWNNIEVSLGTLNGMTLAPGETFDWNSYIGWQTINGNYGYLDAPILVGNDVGYATGGGVCVTSTALFQAARDAGMDILERHDHSRGVSYATPGNEASVSYGSANLIFTNTTGYNVVFYTSCYYGSVSVSCYIA